MVEPLPSKQMVRVRFPSSAPISTRYLTPTMETIAVKSAVEYLESTRVKLTVEAAYEDVSTAVEKAYQEVAGQVNIPGFRRGKAPKQIIDQRVGRGVVLEQAVNNVLPDLYRQAIAENGLTVLSQPEIDVTDIPNVTGPLGGELKFTAEVDVRPEITFPDLSGLEVEVEKVEVTDEDVEERLTALRQRFGSLVGVDREIRDGDFVVIDLKATIDGEEIDSVSGISYEIGSGSMLEGMDEALIGAKADEEKTFTTTLVGGEHAGEEAECTIKATAVKERDLPEADDEFAELASEFDTIDELREDLRTQAGTDKANMQALEARGKLLDHLRENVSFDLPKHLIDTEVESQLEGQEADEKKTAEVREEIEKALHDQLMLDAFAEQYEVEVQQGELIEYLLQSARQYGVDPNQFMQSAAQSGQIPAFAAEIARNKSLMVALREVTVKDSDGQVIDLSVYTGGEDDGEKEAAKKPAAKKSAAKKPAAKKTAAKKTTSADKDGDKPAKKPAAKKTATKKTTAKKATTKKTAADTDEDKPAKKPAAKKTATKKPAAKKTTKKEDADSDK